jgi:hypothetical protein
MPVSYRISTSCKSLTDSASYAVHFGSKQFSSPASDSYAVLQNLQVYTSDSISKVVSIPQRRGTVAIERDKAYFHLADENESLKIYVPKHRRQREVCLLRQLPLGLLDHFGARSPGSRAELGAVLTASKLFVVDDLLLHSGIVEVSGIVNPQYDEDDGYDSSSSDGETLVGQQQLPDHFLHQITPYQATAHQSIPQVLEITNTLLIQGQSHPNQTQGSDERLDLYRELLDAVKIQATTLENLPSINLTTSANPSGRSADTILAVRSPLEGETEKKIGAAGELFVRH